MPGVNFWRTADLWVELMQDVLGYGRFAPMEATGEGSSRRSWVWREWSDCAGDLERAFTRDFLLTTVTLYWLTRTIGTSMRWYMEAWRSPWQPSHSRSPLIEAPSGVTVFTADMPPGSTFEWLDSVFDLRFFNSHDKGGHFAAAERPDALIADLRSFFRPLRDVPPAPAG